MNGPFSMAMLNNQRVGGDIIVDMIVLKHLFLTARAKSRQLIHSSLSNVPREQC